MKSCLVLTVLVLAILAIAIVVASAVMGTAGLIALGLVSLSPAFPFGLAMILSLGILAFLFGFVVFIVIAADNF